MTRCARDRRVFFFEEPIIRDVAEPLLRIEMNGDVTVAKAIVLSVFEEEPYSPDVWDAFARLCAETNFDPAPFVTKVPDDHNA